MFFLIHAFDHTDAEAINRRLAARETHLSAAREMHQNGKLILGGAMVDPSDKMIGSVIIVEMESLVEVEQWLQSDVYISGNVWDKVTVYPMKIALR
jgi:uncharacterized protein YciI